MNQGIAPAKYKTLDSSDAQYLKKLDAAFQRKEPIACPECEKQKRINTNLWLTLEETGTTSRERVQRFAVQQKFFAFGFVVASLLWWLVKVL